MGFQVRRLEIYGGQLEGEEEVVWLLTKASSVSWSKTEISEVGGAVTWQLIHSQETCMGCKA
jgi:hypothetical protein